MRECLTAQCVARQLEVHDEAVVFRRGQFVRTLIARAGFETAEQIAVLMDAATTAEGTQRVLESLDARIADALQDAKATEVLKAAEVGFWVLLAGAVLQESGRHALLSAWHDSPKHTGQHSQVH
jgi:hypothetical protein